jgi:hypothetical protein
MRIVMIVIIMINIAVAVASKTLVTFSPKSSKKIHTHKKKTSSLSRNNSTFYTNIQTEEKNKRKFHAHETKKTKKRTSSLVSCSTLFVLVTQRYMSHTRETSNTTPAGTPCAAVSATQYKLSCANSGLYCCE